MTEETDLLEHFSEDHRRTWLAAVFAAIDHRHFLRVRSGRHRGKVFLLSFMALAHCLLQCCYRRSKAKKPFSREEAVSAQLAHRPSREMGPPSQNRPELAEQPERSMEGRKMQIKRPSPASQEDGYRGQANDSDEERSNRLVQSGTSCWVGPLWLTQLPSMPIIILLD